MKTGYQGIDGAFSSMASWILFPKADKYIGFDTFVELFNSLELDIVDYIVIPIENSFAGRVSDVHNLILRNRIYFHKECILKIEHNLLIKPGFTLQDIKEVHSHEQAIMQCEAGLRGIFSKMPHVKFIKMEDTAMAAQKCINGDGSLAAISSKKAAQIYGLDVAYSSIQDSNENYTTFILASRQDRAVDFNPSEKYITSIMLTVNNQVGAIHKALGHFAKLQIDLIKLESYIPGGVKSKNCSFFISFFGHKSEERCIEVFKNINSDGNLIYFFGSYQSDDKRF